MPFIFNFIGEAVTLGIAVLIVKFDQTPNYKKRRFFFWINILNKAHYREGFLHIYSVMHSDPLIF